MFGKLKKKLGFSTLSTTFFELPAPVSGRVVALNDVPDPTFRDGVLGSGAAIHPAQGRIVSPIDGIADIAFPTGHAVSLRGDNGLEVLIHIGLDTVNRKGNGFHLHVQSGQRVTTGTLLIEFDREQLLADGYDVITPVIICNSGDYACIDASADQVEEGASFLQIYK